MTLRKLTYYIIALFLLIGVSACSGDEPRGGSTEPVPDAEGQLWIALEVNLRNASGGLSRSNPTPGEDGDGREDGQANENKIHELTVFVYNGEITYGAYTPVIASEYVPEDSLTKLGDDFAEAAIAVKDYTHMPSHRILAVANAGDLTGLVTLGEIRDYCVESSWRGADVNQADWFVMSNCNQDDGLIEKKEGVVSGSRNTPNFEASCEIERLAARVDIMCNDSQLNDNRIDYTVAKSGARVRLTNYSLLNDMQQPSWLIKRVSRSLTNLSPVYCGSEGPQGVVPDCYVIDRSLVAKSGMGAMTANTGKLTEWFGASSAFDADKIDWTEANGFSTADTRRVEGTESGYNTNVIVAYTNENTQKAADHHRWFITSLMLRAEYIPKRIYTDATLENYDEPTAPTSFWRYKPSKANLTDDVCLYFSTPEAAQAYKDAHSGDVAEISDEFKDGICYYNVWLRHAYDAPADPHGAPMAMEYGIVRNNIYRLGLSFTGPGTPTPETTEPETIRLSIFVRPWNRVPQDDIWI